VLPSTKVHSTKPLKSLQSGTLSDCVLQHTISLCQVASFLTKTTSDVDTAHCKPAGQNCCTASTNSCTHSTKRDCRITGVMKTNFHSYLVGFIRNKLNSLDSKGNYSATSNNTKLVHRPLMGGLLHLVQRGEAWVGCSPTESPPRCTKCNSPPINSQCINRCIAIWWSVALWF